MTADGLGIGKERRLSVPSESTFVHRYGYSLRGVAVNPSTGDPQMGIDSRIAQNGHDEVSYPQYYPHPRSTPGDILGIKTDRRWRGWVTGGFVE